MDDVSEELNTETRIIKNRKLKTPVITDFSGQNCETEELNKGCKEHRGMSLARCWKKIVLVSTFMVRFSNKMLNYDTHRLA